MMRTLPPHKVTIKPKIDELFVTFLNLTETQTFIKSLITNAKNSTLDDFLATTQQQINSSTQPPLSPTFSRHNRSPDAPSTTGTRTTTSSASDPRGAATASPPKSKTPGQTAPASRTPPASKASRAQGGAATDKTTTEKEQGTSSTSSSQPPTPLAPTTSTSSSAAASPAPPGPSSSPTGGRDAAQIAQTTPSAQRPHPSVTRLPPSLFVKPNAQRITPPETQLDAIRGVFSRHPEGVSLSGFRDELIRQALELPLWFARPVFRRVGTEFAREGAIVEVAGGKDGDKHAASFDENGTVSEAQVLAFFNTHCKALDRAERLFNALRQRKNNFITPTDWKPFLEDLLDIHPGLDFLRQTREFQQRYLETVIERIFYTANRAEDERLTLRELRGSDVAEVCHHCDEEANINKISRYFSYEHFYVIYCKFWELDQDHDQLINDNDLYRYANYALSSRAIDRIVNQQAPRRLRSGVPGRMCFRDFVWFILSEEDKTTPAAISYWFRVCDLDGDGVLSAWEMEQLFSDQLQRLEGTGADQVRFTDILVQCVDMINPRGRYTPLHLRKGGAGEKGAGGEMGGASTSASRTSSASPSPPPPESATSPTTSSAAGASSTSSTTLATGRSPFDLTSTYITLGDMQRAKLSGLVFNILTNITKYVQFDTKDPFGVRDQNQGSDWERFALDEYDRLSRDEEEANEMGGNDIADDLDGGH